MYVEHRIELEPDSESAERDHSYERETGADNKSEFRHEQERSERRRQGDRGENLAADSRSNRAARNTQERMRIRRCGWNHYILLATEPQDHGGDEHEHPRNAEGEYRSEIPQEDRHEERGKE